MLTTKKDVLEGLVVFAIMTGLLLPVRLFFVSFISDNWFGSFGLISLVSFSIIILSKRGKLGFFGKMFERQLKKFQRGKRAKIAYGQAIFFLIILGGVIFAIESGNSQFSDIKKEMYEQNSDLSDREYLLEKSKEVEFYEWVYGVIGLFLAVFVAFPQLAAVLAILNDTFDGWVLHFYTVGFVEYLELFSILLVHRFILEKKKFSKLHKT